jgi:hypothetical protein
MSKLKVNSLVKSNILKTMGGHGMSMSLIETKPCMLERKHFNDLAADTIGGNSKLEENNANMINASVAKLNRSGSWLGGHGRHFRFSM